MEEDKERVNDVLSSILDIYVITSNSPPETKYDIFARLNKGSAPLKVDEIRKAIYRSYVTQIIDEYVNERLDADKKAGIGKEYREIFSPNDIKRFRDYGRFYRSLAFFINSNLNTKVVENYNSRPKEMIDNVLQNFQREDSKNQSMSKDEVLNVLNRTIDLLMFFKDNPNREYLVDCFIPFFDLNMEEISALTDTILQDVDFNNTFEKSKATTSNVNKRLEVAINYFRGIENGN